ncbi:hypothetical protein CGGC5_v016717 [Colletotrichum fructicola Nara gc5]|uniref:Uncharacterized protein n=2 Tax=Colletotrichum fructicola (strain Nara gc5) TaxID=1213859 RepID=A0A7J6IDN2_COLFN|nr:hypothetical protein CGGC5_v016717 [Colletotrichum fructicola Nara gc5]KAF4884809.1 hypothetical protein CGCFRS4_v012423 [Colletotrichum fructicola]
MDSKVKKEEQSSTSSLAEIPSVTPEEHARAKSLPAPATEHSATVMADNPSTYQQSHSQHSATVMAENPSTHQQSHPQHSFGTKNLSEILKKKNKTMNRQRRKIQKLEKELEKCSKPRPVQQDANVILLRAEVERLNRELRLKEEKSTSQQEYVVSYLEKSISNYLQHLEDQLSQMEEGYQGAMQNLQADISTLQNTNKKLTSQLMEKKASIAKAKSLAKAGKVSDDAILSLWKKMKYSIHNIASTILTECPSWEEIKTNIAHSDCVLSILTPRYHVFLKDEDTRSSIVELLIWEMLQRQIFKPFSETLTGVCWGGLEGQCFSVILEGMADTALKKDADAKSFFQWKAEGARMIDDMFGVDNQKLKQMADEQAATFYLFVPKRKVHQKTAMERLFKNLCTVIEDALSLHKIFMTSKAHFTLDWPLPGRCRLTRYDSE